MMNFTGRRSSCRFNGKRFFAIPALCLTLVVGCTTTINSDRAQAQLESLSKEADTALSAGQRDKAISLLNQAAKENPTSVLPWMKMAKISFDEGDYPATIQAANEALQRDSANQEAKSLLVVSGLRIASNSVVGLRSLNAVNSNVRVEAENLTDSLRAVLGEKVLVPAPAAESRPASRPTPRKAKRAAPTRTVVQTQAGADVADPFKSLK
ncbi:tetratricopeptide repeat protein [Noviherbaspirillum autotrophicum]|uniref:tetratricopeptide repeat protein n=1 Tax=Noviherbaspirillum autotrophicum TaxID=709839 RepID=UPI0012FD5F47|nr:hypothetical protein [Noviherbaspirillum autotrophicum]